MGFFRKIGKALHVIDDPVSSILRKQGGTLGTIGSIMNPGGAVNAKIASGAPINARTMTDPNGWIIPTPPPPETPPAPLPPLVPGAPTSLPPGLMPRPVPYSYPTTNGPLTQQAYRMAGPPTGNMPAAPPINAQPYMPHDVGRPEIPPKIQAMLNKPASGRARLLQMAMQGAIDNGSQGQSSGYRITPGGGVEPIFGRPQSDLPMIDPLDIVRMGIY